MLYFENKLSKAKALTLPIRADETAEQAVDRYKNDGWLIIKYIEEDGYLKPEGNGIDKRKSAGKKDDTKVDIITPPDDVGDLPDEDRNDTGK